MKKTSLLKVFMLLSLLAMQPLLAQFSAGTGTELDPWQVSTVIELDSMRNHLDSHFVLMNDLDFLGTVYDSTNSVKNAGWLPIGGTKNPFKGSFNGQGHKISGLYIKNAASTYVGLFGVLGGAKIENLSLDGASVNARSYVGVLAGAVDSSEISSIYVAGKVKASGDLIGGLIGAISNNTIVKECAANVQVVGAYLVGGLLGSSSNSEVEFSHSKSTVIGKNEVGGFIGDAYYTTLANNFALTESIKGENYVGGLVGFLSHSNISTSYAISKLNGIKNVGGLAGYSINTSTIENSYAIGTIYADSLRVGGLVGDNQAMLTNSYFLGSVKGMIEVGALVGLNHRYGKVEKSYFNSAISGLAKGIGNDSNAQVVVDLSLDEMMQKSSFVNWDFAAIWNIQEDKGLPSLVDIYDYSFLIPKSYFSAAIGKEFVESVQIMQMDSQTPILNADLAPANLTVTQNELHWMPTAIGDWDVTLIVKDEKDSSISFTLPIKVHTYNGAGTPSDPWQITSIAQLDSVRYFKDKSYRLMNDLAFNDSDFASGGAYYNKGIGWLPIGYNQMHAFEGSFHGGGHIISNLLIKDKNMSYVGLFGYISDAIIDSLGVINANVLGRNSVAALAGYARSSDISNSFANGNIIAAAYAGGLVGYSSSKITSSYSTGIVSGEVYVGGLIGYNYASGSVKNSYSTAKTSGYESEIGFLMPFVRMGGGGLIGGNKGSVENCYVTGQVPEGMVGAIVGELMSADPVGTFYDSMSTEARDAFGMGPSVTNVIAASTSDMRQESTFSTWDFATMWKIKKDSTYPALSGVNNAPFAFTDTFTISTSIDPSEFLKNDFDYESIQTNLVMRIVDTAKCTLVDGIIYLPKTAVKEDTLTLSYQVGELLNSTDTLWGGFAKVTLVAGENDAPKLVDTLFIRQNITLSILLDSLAKDPNGDKLSFSIVDPAIHGSLSLTKDSVHYAPPKDYAGLDFAKITASDGLLESSQFIYFIIVANHVPVITEKPEDKLIYENESITLSIEDVKATDEDGDKLSIVLYAGTNYSILADGLSIKPDQDFNGVLSVAFAVSDGIDTSAQQVISITVEPSSSIEKLETIIDQGSLIDLKAQNDLVFMIYNLPKSGSAEIIIYSMQGSVHKSVPLYDQQIGQNSFQMKSDLPSGIYFVQLNQSGLQIAARSLLIP